MPLEGSELREHRLERGATQRSFAASLGVTPNTVARWERDEVPIPPLLVAVLRAEHTARAAHQQISELQDKVQALQRQITIFQLHNLALEHKLKAKRDRGPRPVQATINHAHGDRVYKRLARKYHPDHHPEHATYMADINEMRQAYTKRA